MSSDVLSILVGEVWRRFGMVAKASGSPIVAGTCNYYLKAKTGANAGKWWKNSDQTWAAVETANAMAHDADGNWTIQLAASPFVDGIVYLEYAKESGDLHIAAEGRLLRGQAVIDATLAAVKAKTDLLVTSSVTMTVPVSSSGAILTLTRGDDYSATDARSLDWTGTGWPVLTTAAILFTMRHKTTGAVGLSVAGSVVVGGSGSQTVRAELTAAQTGVLSVGDGVYHYDVQATLASGRIVTLVRGLVTVQRDESR